LQECSGTPKNRALAAAGVGNVAWQQHGAVGFESFLKACLE